MKFKNILLYLFIFVFIIIVSYFIRRNNIKNKPKVIGISVSYQIDNSKSNELRYLYDKQFLRTRYVGQFSKVCKNKNVVFLMVPIDERQIYKIANLVDGMIFTGGDDMNAKFFGKKQHPKANDEIEPENRTKFDIKLIKELVKQNKPIIGICLGMQELNVAFGGDIIQDIESETHSKIKHKGITALKYAHQINISEKSLLHKITGKKIMSVNSGHHQAVNKIADKFVATAVAPDGVVEAIECKKCNNFILGMQWHPEFLIDEENVKIIQAFCDAV